MLIQQTFIECLNSYHVHERAFVQSLHAVHPPIAFTLIGYYHLAFASGCVCSVFPIDHLLCARAILGLEWKLPNHIAKMFPMPKWSDAKCSWIESSHIAETVSATPLLYHKLIIFNIHVDKLCARSTTQLYGPAWLRFHRTSTPYFEPLSHCPLWWSLIFCTQFLACLAVHWHWAGRIITILNVAIVICHNEVCFNLWKGWTLLSTSLFGVFYVIFPFHQQQFLYARIWLLARCRASYREKNTFGEKKNNDIII